MSTTADLANGHVNNGNGSARGPLKSTDGRHVLGGVARIEKEILIKQACERHNLDELVKLADSAGGLLNDSLRRAAWPLFLGCEEEQNVAHTEKEDWTTLPRHRDEDQVQLDVNRAFVYYPSEPENSTNARKAVLSNLIVQVLRQHPMLCYFQGYHDIVQVLLLVLGEQLAPASVARISLLRIRDYMLPSLSPALKHLQLLPAILQSADAELAGRLSKTSPFFALSATLTLYAHDIQGYSDIARLYDFILAHEPIMSIYLFAAIILSRRSELLEVPLDEPDMLHYTLSKLPQPLDLESLITSSLALFAAHPPQKLPGLVWWKLSSLSVLKTSRSLQTRQTLQQGEELFRKQAQQMRRQELQQQALLFISRRRGPIASVAATLLVGAFAIWLGRRGVAEKFPWPHFWKTP